MSFLSNHREAGSAVKSAIIESMKADEAITPNCRIGGNGDNAKAKKPAALISVA